MSLFFYSNFFLEGFYISTMKINSINFNSLNYSIGSKNNSYKTNPILNSNENNNLLSFEASNALKSMVLFKGNVEENKALTSERKAKLEEFNEKYNLQFNDINILSQAFCDKNYPDGTRVAHKDSYQKLEFIGDRVLDMCVTDRLSEVIPNALEGDLTQEKLKIVCNKNISNFGKKLNFEELTTHGKHLEDKKYADMFEALLGAIYVDAGGIRGNGVNKVYDFLNNYFLDEITPKTNCSDVDYFEELSNYINDELEMDPSKLECTVRLKGATFKSRVTYDKSVIARGSGKTSQEAKEAGLKAALKAALEKLKTNEINLEDLIKE